MNPRSSSALLNLCNSSPHFVRIVTKFIHQIAPNHKFSTFVLRQGCFGKVHRDMKNGTCPSLVVNLFKGSEGDGLWIHDIMGSHYKQHFTKHLPGTVVPLEEPFIFDARKVLHAGHVASRETAPSRVILVAFTTLHACRVEPRVTRVLQDLGFPLPGEQDLCMHNNECIYPDYTSTP